MTELAKALVAFHKNAPKIGKDGKANYGSYPTLAGIFDTIREPLTAQNLAVVQQPCTLDSGMPGLRTTLLHASGESISEVMPLAVDKPGPQALGSALTYARRYSVLAILGLVGDEDDDAQSAEKPKKDERVPGPQREAPTLDAEGRKKLAQLRKELIEAGKITVAQYDSAAAGVSDAELLARLERYAERVAA